MDVMEEQTVSTSRHSWTDEVKSNSEGGTKLTVQYKNIIPGTQEPKILGNNPLISGSVK